jgi:EPS-associated MarR family transcriptional regulator
MVISDEHRYRLLKLLAERPSVSQRELARELGVSLGKANYCLTALINKGWVKAQNFKNSDNKRAYVYLLTPGGIEEKATVTFSFLRRKINEYEVLRAEIENLRHEVADSPVIEPPAASVRPELYRDGSNSAITPHSMP